ncbi:hypothetical protein [Deinococcus sp. QL22]|uniref:hypothetical protein n=1 Tax=Deinococcus sp. QL22 TaxID=2939437 RepID=UPI002017CF24|nr:hypothetical protein [Deinococcus sp. QL22]UQN05457.1 hypothetical protein M1R55_11285 [Deinococcus sp. QL22]
MRVKIEQGSKGLWAKRAKAISKGLGGLARDGARSAELHVRRGLQINVYATEPGEYERTKLLLRQVYSAGQANATSLGILVGNRAPYATEIEFGTGPYELSEAQLASYLEVLPRGGQLQFGRSGKAYLLPGPTLGPGITFARTLTRERFQRLMADAWA